MKDGINTVDKFKDVYEDLEVAKGSTLRGCDSARIRTAFDDDGRTLTNRVWLVLDTRWVSLPLLNIGVEMSPDEPQR